MSTEVPSTLPGNVALRNHDPDLYDLIEKEKVGIVACAGTDRLFPSGNDSVASLKMQLSALRCAHLGFRVTDIAPAVSARTRHT